MTKGVSRLCLRGISKKTAYVRVTLDIGDTRKRKIEVPPIDLGFAGKRPLQVFMTLCAFQNFRYKLT